MNNAYWINPVVFLIDTIFSLYLFALILRFLFQWSGADYQNPISRFLIGITHPPLRFLRRFVPSAGRVDTAAIVLMLAVQLASGYLVTLLQGVMPSFAALSIWSVTQILELILNIYLYAIIIRTILSWIGPTRYNPAVSLLFSLTDPILRYSQRLLPDTGGIDLSPIIPLIGIQIIKMLVLPPLQQLAFVLN